MNSRIVQITVIGFIIILLTLVGFNSVQNNALMNQLEETLSGLIEETTQSTEAIQTESQQTATVEGQGQEAIESTPSAPEDDAEQAVNAQESNLEIILPGDNGTVFLSNNNPEIQIRLVITPTLTAQNTISARMFISQKTGTDDSKTPLPAGFSSETTTGQIEKDPINLLISFKKLPPSGKYEGWLVITGQDSSIQPVSQRVTYEVSSSLEETIQHRLTGASAEDNKIVISGIQTWPALLNWLIENPANYLKTDEFPLILWEANLQSIAEGNSGKCGKFEYEIIASELVDSNQGLAGKLEVKPDKDNVSSNSNTVILGLSDIEHPGSYEGTIRIITPSNAQNQLIAVNALVRDSLLFPAIVIFVGSLVLGIAIRNTLGDARKNTAFFQFRIVRARDRLRLVDLSYEDSTYIKDLLQEVELLISINDLEKAQKALIDAEKKLGIPRISDEKGGVLSGDLNTLEGCFISLYQPFREQYFPVEKRMLAYQGDELVFRLSKKKDNNIVECDEASDVRWQILAYTVGTVSKEIVLSEESGQDLKFTPSGVGYYTLKVTCSKCSLVKDSIILEVIKDPVKDAARIVKNKAILSSALWAGIATVGGLVYIEQRVPTFGAPTDYLMALAFALGLSAVSKPVESIADSIIKYFEKGKETKPVNGGGEGDGDSPVDQNNISDTKIPVPEGLVGMTWAEAKKTIEAVNLVAKPDSTDPKDDSVVVSTDPEHPNILKKGDAILCNLEPPDSGNDKPMEEQTGQTEGNSGSAPPDRPKGISGKLRLRKK